MVRGISIETSGIRLDSFLKWAGVTETGGEAKQLILAGEVRVNGSPEKRRSRRLEVGDVVEARGLALLVEGRKEEREAKESAAGSALPPELPELP